MDIIDGQVHIWDCDPRDTLPDDPRNALLHFFANPVTIEIQLAAMDAVGVTATVLNVPAVIYRRRRPDGFVEYDNSYANQAAQRYPSRFYSVAWIDAVAPDMEDAFDELQESPGVVGVRQRIGPNDGLAEVTEGKWERFFSSSARRKFPVFVAAEGILDQLHPVIAKHSETQFVIDHFGLPVPQVLPPESGRPFDQLASLLALAQFPNVAVKWGGAQRLSEEPYPFGDIWPHMHKVIEAFGVERLMFASDWTVCRHLHSYGEAVFSLRDSDEISDSEKSEIFAGTSRRLFHLEDSSLKP